MKDFQIQGINHIALVCKDMARTVDFYTNTLGLNLIKTIALPDGGQHFFFDIGNGDALAFFWFPQAPLAAPGIASVRPDGILLEFAANLRKLGNPERDILHQPAKVLSQVN